MALNTNGLPDYFDRQKVFVEAKAEYDGFDSPNERHFVLIDVTYRIPWLDENNQVIEGRVPQEIRKGLVVGVRDAELFLLPEEGLAPHARVETTRRYQVLVDDIKKAQELLLRAAGTTTGEPIRTEILQYLNRNAEDNNAEDQQ